MNTMNESRSIFDFPKGNHSALITSAELEMSREVLSGKGEPYPTRPVQFWTVLKDIQAILGEHQIEFRQESIIVQESTSKRSFSGDERAVEGFDPKLPAPFKNWEFQNLISLITIPDDINDLEGTIAVAFNSKGIQIAFGMNYSICDNLCILGGQGSVYTTGTINHADVLEYEDIIQNIDYWAKNYEQHLAFQLDSIEILRQTNMQGNFINEMIGRLFLHSFDVSRSSDRNVPFLKDEIYIFARKFKEMLVEKFKKDFINDLTIVSLWDVYNIGTDVIKAENGVNLTSIIPAIRVWGMFLMENYSETPLRLTADELLIQNNINETEDNKSKEEDGTKSD